VRWLIPLVALLALSAISLYGGNLDAANRKFFLVYMLSSQSAILWMSTLFVFSTVFYWLGLASRSPFGGAVGSALCWAAVVLGFTGMMVRWYESYLIGSDVGHIPVSNLYEVFILFSMITALFYLYYEERYATRQLGPFVMLVITAAVGFLMWYTVSRDAGEIQRLLPALQSWWMKIHVPANFDGGLGLPAQVPRHPGRPPARARSTGRRDVQGHFGWLCVLHRRHHPGRPVGSRCLGQVLVLGPEGNLGPDRVA
jgi:hypothetical protein